jgi:hypothetical protein
MKTTFANTSVALVAACTLWAGSAQATVHNLSLSGTVANGNFSSQVFMGTLFDQWVLGLQGLNELNAITVEVGDTINATITLDELFTIPGSVNFTFVGLFLGGSNFPLGDVETTSDAEFFDGMDQVKSGSGGTSTSGQIAAGTTYFPPNNGPITFDSLTISMQITQLSGPATLDYSTLSYSLASPAAVPEPATWAMMIVGFGGVGALMRRRRRDGGLAAFA